MRCTRRTAHLLQVHELQRVVQARAGRQGAQRPLHLDVAETVLRCDADLHNLVLIYLCDRQVQALDHLVCT